MRADYQGHENLETATKRPNLTNWIYEELSPAIKGNILEVGSGLGTYSKKIINDFKNQNVVLTDMSEVYLKNLKNSFSSDKVQIFKLDLNRKEDYENIGYDLFDSILAINVLEHIENDEYALKELYKMLRKDGILILLIPANKFLYNIIDESIGHWRRYTKNELIKKIKKTEFKILRLYSFNLLGILGWYINGNILKNPIINKGASSFYDKLVPFMKIIEKLLGRKVGLSIICFLQK